jgi:spore germination protein GerM
VRRLGFLLVILTVAFATNCKKPRPLTSNLAVENKVALRTIHLYFESPQMLLTSETRDVQLPENPAGALPAVMRELVKGSANQGVPHSLPADTVIRGAYLLPDGIAFIDLGGPTLTQGWPTGSHEELIAVYSIVQTVMANFPQVRRVRLLINGEPAETLAGHVALNRSLGPMPSLVEPQSR